jgi:DegV family protein with EDD domain
MTMFDIFTDSASNLTSGLARPLDISIIPYFCQIDGREIVCYEENRPFEDTARDFYAKMREGAEVNTTLINSGRLAEAFEPSLRRGRNVLFIGMSSALTGTIQAAKAAAAALAQKYPGMRVEICDTLAAGLGEGFLVLKAAKMRAEGGTLDEVLAWLEGHKLSLSEVFTVEDLKYLRHGGRVSGASALIGNILHVKPVLRTANDGSLKLLSKTLGRRRAIEAIVEQFVLRANPGPLTAGITHADCLCEAEFLAARVREIRPDCEIITLYQELCTGGHTGPGTLALFFFSSGRE